MALRKSYPDLLTLYLLLLLSHVIVASGYGYGPNPNTEMPRNIEKEKFFPRVFSVQGVVYCKSASKVLPLKGGVMRITCLGIDKYGYETAPFSKLSRPTDANGYFLTKLSSQLLRDVGGLNITHCNAFLHTSRHKICPFATDFNRGLSGAPLSAYRTLGSTDMRLYSIGPFIYGSNPPQF
ncbi:hypothetical protein ACS0TY_007857 [Phlomoides rotata]